MRPNIPLPPGRSGFPFIGETLPFLKDGFAFIEERARRHGPVFRTRILGRATAVIVGPEACATWIDPERIARAEAQPGFLFELLAGPSLPHLDGTDHRDRRAVVLEAFTPEALDAYVPRLGRAVESALERWTAAGEFRWIPELKRLAVEGICGNFTGLEPGETLRGVVDDYDTLLKGIGGIPFALPGTAFKRALGARDRLLALYEDVIRRHREEAPDDGLSRIIAASAEGGLYADPGTFDPGRLAPPRSEHLKHEHAFVPQGAGSPRRSHRCPGEDYATLFMQVFLVSLLRGGFRWSFPKQRFEYDMSLTPPEPKDGLLAAVSRG